MKKDDLIQLTQNLYRLTLLFPKKEPLRYKIRALADDVLAICLRWNLKQVSKNKTENCSPRALEELEVLESFFEVAKAQNWVSPQDILNLQQEYSKLKEDLKNLEEEKKVIDIEYQSGEKRSLAPFAARESRTISERREKILAFLKENGQAQVWQVKQILPEVTKRTLRRDFEFLLKQGKIERIGERNETFYQLKVGQG